MARDKRSAPKPQLVKQASLSDGERRAMFRLFERYYADVTWPQFRADLAEKDAVFRFFAGGGGAPRLIGFSTIMRRRVALASGRRVVAIFSGDTVIAQEYWGEKFLQAAFFGYIARTKLQNPGTPVYWMLISKGYKTYMMMRRNFRSSYPAAAHATPPEALAAMQRFYADKFGDAYDPASGLIRFGQVKGAVRDGYADPGTADLAHPEIAFYLGKNPGYAEGVELACVAEIRFRDFPGHVLKYFVKPLAARPAPARPSPQLKPV